MTTTLFLAICKAIGPNRLFTDITEREFIRGFRQQLTKAGKARENRELRHKLLRGGLAMLKQYQGRMTRTQTQQVFSR